VSYEYEEQIFMMYVKKKKLKKEKFKVSTPKITEIDESESTPEITEIDESKKIEDKDNGLEDKIIRIEEKIKEVEHNGKNLGVAIFEMLKFIKDKSGNEIVEE
jgi:hypothetical protein